MKKIEPVRLPSTRIQLVLSSVQLTNLVSLPLALLSVFRYRSLSKVNSILYSSLKYGNLGLIALSLSIPESIVRGINLPRILDSRVRDGPNWVVYGWMLGASVSVLLTNAPLFKGALYGGLGLGLGREFWQHDLSEGASSKKLKSLFKC